jgi:two-component system chemotaxis sensor kinase CheA
LAKDPYRFFRIEARELVDALMQGCVRLDGAGEDVRELARAMLRQAHTLKGAARVVKLPGIADRAHAIEDRLGPVRDGADANGASAAVLALVDAIRAELDGLDAPTPTSSVPAVAPVASAPAPAPSRPPTAEISRVEIAEVDALLRELAETSESLRRAEAALAQLAPAVEHAAHLARRGDAAAIALRERLERASRLGSAALAGARAQAGGARMRAELMRLLRVDALLPRLSRVAHDACAEQGKQAQLTLSGGEARIESHALAALAEALEHVVRNAVVHGIESPPERAAAGKPAAGRIGIAFSRRGARVAIACADDGRGVDAEKARAAAVSRGLISAERAKALGADEAAALVLLPGVSTAGGISQVAGRGVGLDVAVEVARRLGGEVRIANRPERGTTVTIEVAASLAAAPVLIAEAAGERWLLPRGGVAETRRLSAEEAEQARSGSLRWGDEVVACASLAALLGRGEAMPARLSALLLRDDAGTAAILVERISGGGEAVLERIPEAAGGDGLAEWMALEHEGAPRILLEPAALANAVRSGRWQAPTASQRAKRKVLVIDDSLTTRMLEQSILESAGYEVELACSAEEGLDRARAAPHALFVVDVEMPGMNGLQFVATIRADARLRATPAILVTSLGTPAHRRAGLEAGADAYIVKGEFDQGRFIETVRGLAG